MGTPFLEVKHISKAFGGVQALQDVSLTINSGESYCLLGENGSGKSTLIKIISGVYTADEGEICIDGKTYSRITPVESIKAGIQIIYQDFSIFPNLTVAENIAVSGQIMAKKSLVNRNSMKKTASDALKRLGVELPLDQIVEELSVAGKQIVAIARGIAQNARLLVMDEPTTALTYKEILALYEIIEGLKKQGIAIIFVSHKLEEVEVVSEKIAVLRNGKKVIDSDIADFDKESLIYYMTGREIRSTPYLFQPGTEKKELLKVEGLSQKNSFADVTFSLYQGEILGITGQLGCGRTELAKALFGIGSAEGSVWLEEEKISLKSIQDAHRYGIGYVPEDRLNEGLFLTRSLADNINTASIDSMGNGIWISQEELNANALHWLKELEVSTDHTELPASSLSGGNQQRIVLAKWLATNPRLLILNCPTVGVDVGSKHQIHEIIKSLAQKGMGVIVISDDMGEILTLCNRVLVMKNGRITREVNSSDVSEKEMEEYLISVDQ